MSIVVRDNYEDEERRTRRNALAIIAEYGAPALGNAIGLDPMQVQQFIQNLDRGLTVLDALSNLVQSNEVQNVVYRLQNLDLPQPARDPSGVYEDYFRGNRYEITEEGQQVRLPPRQSAPVSNLPSDTQVAGQDTSERMSKKRAIEQVESTAEPMAFSAAVASETPTESGKGRQVMPMYRAPSPFPVDIDRTVVRLPLVVNFSINRLRTDKSVNFQFMLNDTYNIFRRAYFRNQQFNITTGGIVPGITETAGNAIVAVPNAFSSRARGRGLSRDMAFDQYYNNGTSLVPKPVNENMWDCRQFIRTTPCETPGTVITTLSTSDTGTFATTGEGHFGNADGDLAPDGRNFYERLYQVRHVHGCKWKMIIENASKSDESRGCFLHRTETLTNGNQSIQNNDTIFQARPGELFELQKPLDTVLSWNTYKKNVVQGKYSTISGMWRSDQSAKSQDVVDAQEIKDWYTTEIPNEATYQWQEYETFQFYSHPDAVHEPSFNCRLEIEYLVEYRDRKKQWRQIDRDSTTSTMMASTTDFCTPFPTPNTGTGGNFPGRAGASQLDSSRVSAWFGGLVTPTH